MAYWNVEFNCWLRYSEIIENGKKSSILKASKILVIPPAHCGESELCQIQKIPKNSTISEFFEKFFIFQQMETKQEQN